MKDLKRHRLCEEHIITSGFKNTFKTIVKVLKQDDIKFGEELIIKDLNIEREHSNSTNK